MLDRDTVGARRLWARTSGGDYGGLIAADGLLYYSGGFRAEKGPGEDWSGLDVIDGATGKMVRHMPLMRKGGNYWALSAVSADAVFIVGGDGIFRGSHPKPPSDAIAVLRGQEPVVLARNVIDRTYGSPVMEGERIYLRGYQGVTCIGYTGAEGRAFEARAVARTILDGMQAERPRQTRLLEPRPSADRQDAKTISSLVLAGQGPHSWLIAGPFASGDAETLMAPLGGVGGRPKAGDATAAGGVFRPLSAEALRLKGVFPWETDPKNLSLIHRHRRTVDLGKVLAGQVMSAPQRTRHDARQTPCVVLLFAEVRVESAARRDHAQADAPCIVRFELPTPNARAWIGGLPLKTGERVRLPKGLTPLLVEVRAGSIPPDGLLFSPAFWSSDDVKAEEEAWLAVARLVRPWLERVTKLAPASEEAARASLVLAGL
jgi:hypothetical protein